MPIGMRMRTRADDAKAKDEAMQVRALPNVKAAAVQAVQAAQSEPDPCVARLAALGKTYWDLAKARLDRMAAKDARVASVSSNLDLSARSFNVSILKMNEGVIEEAVRQGVDGVFYARMAWELAR